MFDDDAGNDVVTVGLDTLTNLSITGTATASGLVTTTLQADTLTAGTAEQVTVNDGLTVGL